jgi:hypothetical protein
MTIDAEKNRCVFGVGLTLRLYSLRLATERVVAVGASAPT